MCKRKIQSMENKNGESGKSAREMAKKGRYLAVWIGVIGIVFVVIIWILLQNSKVLEIGGIGILVILLLLRIVPGFFDK